MGAALEEVYFARYLEEAQAESRAHLPVELYHA